MAEVFRDGEPVDPQKLRNLQQQITDVQAVAGSAFNLANKNSDGTTETFQFITRSDTITFENLKNGSILSEAVELGFVQGDLVITVATPRYSKPNFYKVNVSLSGPRLSPTINVSQTNVDKKTMEKLVIDYISVGKRKIELD